jgi:DNA-binding NarL/FixJ family response regulator
MIRLLIADDHQLFIDGLSTLLQSQPNIEIIGHALNGQEVVHVLSQKQADILLLDLKMPDTDILALSKEIQVKFPSTRIIILTMYHGADYFEELVKIGIGGYIYKSVGKNELIETIEQVYAGKTVHTADFAASAAITSQATVSPPKVNPIQLLTSREMNILQMLAQKYSQEEIADNMFVSLHTVAVHYNNIILKLGVKDHSSLLQYCHLHHLSNT